MSLEKLIGSLMAYEINMERLGESSSKKKHSNALKAEEDTSEEDSYSQESMNISEDEEAMLSRRLQRILAKKKKYQSRRRYFKKGKDFKRSEVKGAKKTEPICHECKKPRHIKAECPKLQKTEFRKKDNTKRPKIFKKKAMAAAWNNSSDSDSDFVHFHHFRRLTGAHGKTLVRAAVLDGAGIVKIWCDSQGDFEGFQATLCLDDWRVGGPPSVSQDVESVSVLFVLLVVVSRRSPWSPFSTARGQA
ncbi:hypothetical protein Taro_015707 [Colocasia esculenta]|uniref:CCHC-type domain-containing protein n=1 Tax=Colocasia esculenta TaxID=4460 RepID=A0A843UTZ9_COLES|nr:hypothetical protein [Colocasia esculenta]